MAIPEDSRTPIIEKTYKVLRSENQNWMIFFKKNEIFFIGEKNWIIMVPVAIGTLSKFLG